MQEPCLSDDISFKEALPFGRHRSSSKLCDKTSAGKARCQKPRNFFPLSRSVSAWDAYAALTLRNAVEVVQQLVYAHLRQVLELRIPAHLVQHGVELRRVRRVVSQMMHL